MKNILTNFSLENISAILQNLARKYSVPLIFLGVTAICFIAGITLELLDNEVYFKIIITGILSFFLSTGISMYANAHIDSKTKRLYPQTISVVFALLYYLFLYNFEDYISACVTLSLLFGFIGFIFVGAYAQGVIKKDEAKNMHYFPYFETVFYAFVFSLGLGIVLSILGGLAYFSISELFDLHSSDILNKIIGYWFVIANVVIAPIFGLYKLPIEFLKDDEYNEEHHLGIFALTPEGIIKYIFLPAIILYFIILYAYSLKLLINFGDWPKGQVSWFVIIFGILGYFTYIFSYPFEHKNTIVQKYRTYFPMIALPQIFILFYAIYLRINSYGLTTNRYLVVLFGLWLLGLSIYFIASKNKKLIYIPATIAIITLITSIGPWSLYNLPMISQQNKLENLLMQEGILGADKTLTNGDWNISPENENNIRSTIKYLCDIDNCQSMGDLFQIDGEDMQDKDRNNKWDIQSVIFEKLGIEKYDYSTIDDNIIHFDIEQPYVLDIQGYRTIEEYHMYAEHSQSVFDTSKLSTETIEDIIKMDAPKYYIDNNTTIYITSLSYDKSTQTMNYINGYIVRK